MEQLQRGRGRRRRLLKRKQMGKQWNVLQRRRCVQKRCFHIHPTTSWPVFVSFVLLNPFVPLGDSRNKETEDWGERRVHRSWGWSYGLELFLCSSLFGQSDLVEFVLLCIFKFCYHCPHGIFDYTEACNIMTPFSPPFLWCYLLV